MSFLYSIFTAFCNNASVLKPYVSQLYFIDFINNPTVSPTERLASST